MPNFEEMFCSCDQATERKILCFIMVSRKMIPDLIPDYFTGSNRKLFNALNKQWETGDIDPVILKADFELPIHEILQDEATNSEHAIEILNHFWKIRAIAEMCLRSQGIESIDEVIQKIQFESGQIALRKTGNKYCHREECSNLVVTIDRAHQNKNKIAGYETGLTVFDETTNGITR